MTYADQVLALNPLAYYRFGDASGSVMADSSGNGRNGRYGTSSLPAFGIAGIPGGGSDTAVTFNAANNQYAVVDYASWMNTPNQSVSIWFKTTSTGAFGVVGRWGSNSGLFIDMLASDGIRAYGIVGGATQIASATVTGLRNGAWHHAVGAFDGSAVKLYVDKVLAATATAAGSLTATSTDPIKVGFRDGTGDYFPGTLDELSYHSTGLTQTQVSTLYDDGITAPVPSFTGTWGTEF